MLRKLLLTYMLIGTLNPVNVEINDIITQEVTISFAGDFTLGGYKGQTKGNTFSEYYEQYGSEYFLEDIKEVFENDDLTFVNLECTLTDFEQTVNKKYPIKGNPEYVDILKNGSIEICGLANNHIFDSGINGFEQTKKVLEENNIYYCGEGTIANIEKNSIKISCLSYRGFSDSSTLREQILTDLTNEKEKSDIICVMLHFGNEYEFYSNKNTESLAHFIADNGANIIVAAHPHVIQGIEIYNNVPICYSLGNFCFGANKNPKDKDTFIFQQTFVKNKNEIILGKSEVIPCKISSSENKNDYNPRLATEEESKRIIDRLKEYSSKYKKTIFK